MDTMMTAIEMTATVDEHHQLTLDGTLPIIGPVRVKVIVLHPLTDKLDEPEWLRAAAHNPAFAFLRESTEEIYSPDDGKPLDAEA